MILGLWGFLNYHLTRGRGDGQSQRTKSNNFHISHQLFANLQRLHSPFERMRASRVARGRYI